MAGKSPSQKVTSTEFSKSVGFYIDKSAKNPVVITKHDRPVRVLIDVEEYARLKRYDTREALYPHELAEEDLAEFEKGYQGEDNLDLDDLLE